MKKRYREGKSSNSSSIQGGIEAASGGSSDGGLMPLGMLAAASLMATDNTPTVIEGEYSDTEGAKRREREWLQPSRSRRTARIGEEFQAMIPPIGGVDDDSITKETSPNATTLQVMPNTEHTDATLSTSLQPGGGSAAEALL